MGILKKRKTKEGEIILGIDIGTQFSYLGYIADGKFQGIEDEQVADSHYGFSSTIAFDNKEIILCGYDADEHLLKYPNRYRKLPMSAKSAVREYGFKKFSTLNGEEYDPQTYLKAYIEYLKGCYDRSCQGKKIKKIAVAFPDTDKRDKEQRTAEEAYKNCLKKAVKKAFNVTDVVMHSEASMVADLIAKLYFAQNIQEGKENYNDIMVIDIGAGTSDIGIACWNGKQQYKIEDVYQKSVNFGGKIIDDILTTDMHRFKFNTSGNPLLKSTTSPVSLIKYKKLIYKFNKDPNFNDYGLTINNYYSRSYSADVNESRLVQLRREIEGDDVFKSSKNALEDAIQSVLTDYQSKNQNKKLEVVVLGNTSTIPPVVDMIDKVFDGKKNCEVHFLDNETDKLSNALRKKGVTNSNFMAFACAFVGGGISTEDINDIKILNADETEKKEVPGSEGGGIGENIKTVVTPTIHGAGADSIFAIQVYHNHKDPHFKAWDLISSPLAHEGKQYFLVGPYVDHLENPTKPQFTPVIVNRLKLKDNAPILYAEDDNPNRNFLITEFVDKCNKPEYIDGKDYYTYENNCKAIESLSGIEIVGRGHSDKKSFKVNASCYVGVIYDYNPATPVDKKLQIYYWRKQQDAAYKGGVCYYDQDKQEKIDFETFRNEAKKDGRCNLYS